MRVFPVYKKKSEKTFTLIFRGTMVKEKKKFEQKKIYDFPDSLKV